MHSLIELRHQPFFDRGRTFKLEIKYQNHTLRKEKKGRDLELGEDSRTKTVHLYPDLHKSYHERKISSFDLQ